ncbi:MAG TPA: hypothetical protein VGF45_03835, partial [Polyangia bacterium]
LTDDPNGLDPALVAAAARLRSTPTQPPPLVQLGRRDEPTATSLALLADARAIVAWAQARVAALAARSAGVN